VSTSFEGCTSWESSQYDKLHKYMHQGRLPCIQADAEVFCEVWMVMHDATKLLCT